MNVGEGLRLNKVAQVSVQIEGQEQNHNNHPHLRWKVSPKMASLKEMGIMTITASLKQGRSRLMVSGAVTTPTCRGVLEDMK